VGEVIEKVNPADARGAAFLDQAAALLRGASYTAFDGTVPDQPGHGGVAATYAHVTAPLRRLADRYATEVCLALHEGTPVPGGTRAARPRLPAVMTATDRVASAAERAAVELTEAVLLQNRVGEEFDAAVVDVEKPRDTAKPGRTPRGTVALDEPPVVARCDGDLPLGERVRVRLVTADPTERRVLFELA
jgi:exoribonuclease R